MTNEGKPCLAERIHAGNVCVACRHEIVIGERIVVCEKCASISHSNCWNAGGCSSFYCSEKMRSAEPLVPDLVFSKNQVAAVTSPPRGRVFSSESIAKDVETRGSTWNGLGVISLIFGIFSFGLAVRFVSGSGTLDAGEAMVFFSTLLSGLVTVIISVIFLSIGKGRSRFMHSLPTMIGLVCGAFAMGLALVGMATRHQEEELAIPKFDSNQVKKFIERASPIIRMPLMANVLVTVGSNFSEGAGSGVILRTHEGFAYIISNLHVVTLGKMAKALSQIRKNSSILVTFFNGEQHEADPIWLGSDGLDVVVLKVSAPKSLSLASKIQKGRFPSIGDRVFAIGNPLGLNWSFTEGVISAIRPQLFGLNEIPLIQMQTPLNPGNSGGGLYDKEGFLIGINTWIYSKSISEGLNFSIAMDGILSILDPSLLKLLENFPVEDEGKNNERQAEAPPGGPK